MASELLTTVELKALSDKDAGTILSDGGGLRGRVRLNRKKQLYVQFEYKYRSNKKSRTVKIANYPDKSLSQIREIHRKVKSDLADGIDPIDARNTEKLARRVEQANAEENHRQELARIAAETASKRTLKDAIQEWERLELVRRKDKGAETMRAINKDIIPSLGDLALSDITKAMLVDEMFRVVERGSLVMANHLLSTLKQFYNFACTREWVESNPLAGLSRDKIGGREQPRERYLSQDEIIELKNALPKANLLQTTEYAIWIMLSTCCRVGEISQAKWENVDLDQGTWLIPAGNSKNAKEHTIYLSDFTQDHFHGLKSHTGKKDWCLPGLDGKNHICIKSIAKQVRDRTRDEPLSKRTKATGSLIFSGGSWTPHDLRRSGATLMGELGVNSDVIDRCQNHVEANRMKRIYQRQELKAEQREAWKKLGDRLSLLLYSDEDSKITVANFDKSA